MSRLLVLDKLFSRQARRGTSEACEKLRSFMEQPVSALYAGQKYMFLHDINEKRLNNYKVNDAVLEQEALRRLVSEKKMPIYSGSGLLGRSNGLYAHAAYFDRRGHLDDLAPFVNFFGSSPKSKSSLAFLPDKEPAPRVAPHMSGSLAAFWSEDIFGESIPVVPIISRTTTACFDVQEASLFEEWMAVTVQDLLENKAKVAELCSVLGLNATGNMSLDCAQITKLLFHDPFEQELALSAVKQQIEEVATVSQAVLSSRVALTSPIQSQWMELNSSFSEPAVRMRDFRSQMPTSKVILPGRPLADYKSPDTPPLIPR